MGLNKKISQEFTVDDLIPCAGQGIIAAQCRDNDNEIREILEKINDEESRILANTEREVLKILEGDCDTAIGVYAKIENEKINLKTELFSIDGKERYFINESDKKNSFLSLGKNIGEQLKTKANGSYKR